MVLTLGRRLELVGALSKVQPQLQRLHIVEKPKKRHLLRNVTVVGSTIAAGTIVAVAVFRRRGRRIGDVAGRLASSPATARIWACVGARSPMAGSSSSMTRP
jgi:hypothetical protein